ncbi:MAG: GNAT family N-acetyltransferase [Cyanobacteriota bacterium]|nr:GNAT family N-acetyltransferase [Cyanobacteriota bacterium]
MTSEFEYCTAFNSQESQRLGEILSQCFNGSPSDWPFYLEKIGVENFRLIRRREQVVGGLATLYVSQWFGSQLIPMAGIASVGVSPEHRGTGAAVELLTHTLKELYAKGVPLSALYAATQRPYRKVGYEQAGTCCHWELPIETIRLPLVQEIRTLPMQLITPDSLDVLQALHHQWALKNNGNLERNPTMWDLLVQPRPDEVRYIYLVGSQEQPEGYIIFTQQPESDGYNLKIQDWVALTPAAVRRLWIFVADHRSVANQVIWRGPALDPILLLLPEQSDRLRLLERWLLRVVDVPKALEQRGYPTGVEAQLHLDVRDDLLLENNGQFVLTVSGGRGEVSRGGKGELQLDVRTLAPLYSGLFTPYQLQLTGQIVATDDALTVATQLFTGSEPWMPDKF